MAAETWHATIDRAEHVAERISVRPTESADARELAALVLELADPQHYGPPGRVALLAERDRLRVALGVLVRQHDGGVGIPIDERMDAWQDARAALAATEEKP